MECGFGYQATQKLINSAKAANYCAKYASKTNPDTPKGFRRVRASRDWTKLPDFEGDSLLVRAKTELLSDYLLRVHYVSGVPIDDLLYVWSNELARDRVVQTVTKLDTTWDEA